MIVPNFKLDKDGPTSKILPFSSLSGLKRNFKLCTKTITNSVPNGVLLKKQFPEGRFFLILRTENKIKNKFYGNIRIYLRFIVNYFNDSKEDTMWIHKINPSILNDIYKGNKGKILLKQNFLNLGTKCKLEFLKWDTISIKYVSFLEFRPK